MMNIAIIPARGGSKRIPKKNIKSFCGNPLISYSIKVAQKSNLFDKIVVSTDDETIAGISKSYGANIQMRPKNLSDDFTGTWDVVSYVLDTFKKKGEKYRYACTIYATAPFLKEIYLKKGLEELKGSNCIRAFSATTMPFPIQRAFRVVNQRCEMFTPEFYNSRSQDLEESFQDAGQFYWEKIGAKSNEPFFGKDSIPIILPRHLVQDIDTMEDFIRAQYMHKAIFLSTNAKEVNQEKEIVMFRSDSSSNIGLGHIMRDLVFAKKYKNNTIYFACRDLKGGLHRKIPYKVELLKTSEINELISLIKKLHVGTLIIDHYDITYSDEKRIKEETSVKLICFDDEYKEHFCDEIINHNLGAKKHKYKNTDIVKIIQPLIRDEFYEAKKQKSKKIYDIFISMGGTDNSNINLAILKKLDNLSRVVVVTSSGNINIKELENYIKFKNNIELHVDSNKIAKLLSQSRLAITTTSVMVYEVLFMEIPFIAIKTAENQDDTYEHLKKNGYDVFSNFKEWSNTINPMKSSQCVKI